MEHRGWTFRPDGSVKSAFGERTDLLSSVAFWYQRGIARGLPDLPYGSARLPQGNAHQIEVERALLEVEAEKGDASLVKELFWSKDVLAFEAEGPGSRIEVPFDVPEDGDYEVYTQIAQGPEYGMYTVLLDGKPPQAPELEHEPGADVLVKDRFDGYAPETYVGYDYQVGWPRLSRGRHRLTFVCLGKSSESSGYRLAVDNIILARTGTEAWASASKTASGRLPSLEVSALARSLAAEDPFLRGLAAIALSGLRPSRRPGTRRAPGSAPRSRREREDDGGERDRRPRPRRPAGHSRSRRRRVGRERGRSGVAGRGIRARRHRSGSGGSDTDPGNARAFAAGPVGRGRGAPENSALTPLSGTPAP